VTLVDVNREAAEAVAREIGGFAAIADVSDAAAGEAAVKAARERHGPARILINVAGILIPGRIVGKDGPLALEKFARSSPST
jgi:NAD(P)-dependent dehydrogenase (short-subunit alcohol dehydrogenase family)